MTILDVAFLAAISHLIPADTGSREQRTQLPQSAPYAPDCRRRTHGVQYRVQGGSLASCCQSGAGSEIPNHLY